jgi:hypothetical protein
MGSLNREETQSLTTCTGQDMSPEGGALKLRDLGLLEQRRQNMDMDGMTNLSDMCASLEHSPIISIRTIGSSTLRTLALFLRSSCGQIRGDRDQSAYQPNRLSRSSWIASIKLSCTLQQVQRLMTPDH